MLESFLSLSPAAIVAVSVVLPVLVAVPFALGILARKIPSAEGDADVLSPMVGFVGTSFSLLLAFVIVTVWSDQTDRQKILFAEMTTIEDILVESRTIAPDKAPHLKAAALKYLDLMREREIDEKAPSGGDPAAERAFDETLVLIQELERTLSADPARQAEAQGFFDETREWVRAREERVNTPPTQLDEIMTGVLIVLALLTVISVALLPSTTSAWAKWAQTLGVSVTVGLTLSLVFYISSDAFTRDAEDQQIARVQQALAATITPVQVAVPSPPSPAAPR
jgi:hypothetical protein